MRLLILCAALPVLLLPASAQHNVLSQSEIDSGFTLLFDGQTVDENNWGAWAPKHDPIQQQYYFVDPAEEAMAKKGSQTHAHLMTDSIYGDFVLKFQFKITHQTGADAANSGIIYRAFNGQEWVAASGIEYQMMDISTIQNNSTGAAYGIYPPSTLPWKSNDWNEGIIVADGDHVLHNLNGEVVVDYDMQSQDFLSRLSSSRFGDYQGQDPVDGSLVDFSTSKRGYIVIQNYGAEYDWWFRDMKIARLPVPEITTGCKDSLYEEYDPEVQKHDPEMCVALGPIRPVDPSSPRLCRASRLRVTNGSAGIHVRVHYGTGSQGGSSGTSVAVDNPGFHVVRVFDVKGNERAVRMGSGSITYFVPGLEPGIYFISVVTPEYRRTGKIHTNAGDYKM